MCREIAISHWMAPITFLAREPKEVMFRSCQNGWDGEVSAYLASRT
jgi:hypothetical protein